MRNAAESIIFTVAIYFFFYYFNIKSMFNILQNYYYLFVYIMVKIQYIGIALKITFF